MEVLKKSAAFFLFSFSCEMQLKCVYFLVKGVRIGVFLGFTNENLQVYKQNPSFILFFFCGCCENKYKTKQKKRKQTHIHTHIYI